MRFKSGTISNVLRSWTRLRSATSSRSCTGKLGYRTTGIIPRVPLPAAPVLRHVQTALTPTWTRVDHLLSPYMLSVAGAFHLVHRTQQGTMLILAGDWILMELNSDTCRSLARVEALVAFDLLFLLCGSHAPVSLTDYKKCISALQSEFSL